MDHGFLGKSNVGRRGENEGTNFVYFFNKLIRDNKMIFICV
jgi:hypothetical protein